MNIGTVVEIHTCAEASLEKHKGKLFVTAAEPRDLCGTEVVAINLLNTGERINTAFATEYLKPMLFPQITFSEFNTFRSARGADAARFDILDEDSESYRLWMSESDIRRNIMQYPHCRNELEKGLRKYNPFGEVS